ncbi:MAG TPA: CoA transferase [Acidimicrobiales bacterium]|nr:CoA transferase [Acidimicrobiales bacterium]
MSAPCEPAAEVAAWAASGAMWLTGPSGEAPLGPPAGLVPKLAAIGDVLADRAAALGGHVVVEPLARLGQRAAIAGLRRHGDTSCGGATRLLPAADGCWLAVSLARPTDVELVPAWLETGPIAGGVAPDARLWDAVAARVAAAPAGVLLDRALLLGLPVAVLPDVLPAVPHAAPPAAPPDVPPAPPVVAPPLATLPLRAVPVAGPPAPPRSDLHHVLVADLSSLWAGPLAGALLAAAGATVVKVESTGRPDGARLGPAAFFDLLNAGKRSVALDLRSRPGQRLLHGLLARADVVIEASRPRALEQMGIDATALLAQARPRAWVSITGHGRTGPGRDRVGFGDDAAVAGGLVCWDGARPCFCADAIADPTSGIVAAAAALGALAAGGRWLLDVSMAGVAAHLAGPTLPAGDPPPLAVPPHAGPAPGHAPPLGRDTRAVLDELGLAGS